MCLSSGRYVRSRVNTPTDHGRDVDDNGYNSDDTDEGGRRYLQYALRQHRRRVVDHDAERNYGDAHSDDYGDGDDDDDSFADYSD